MDNQEIFIESQESKTVESLPVYNKIKLFSFKNKDVWMMNQSHFGIEGLGPSSWDRLAIVVDKTQNPKRAKFYQLEPGPLEWSETLKEVPFKVSCFICHNNGPRAIRPNYESSLKPVSFKERIKVSYWNLKMKLYGRVLYEDHDLQKTVPFRYQSKFENEALKVRACANCHKDSGLFVRGQLSRQQALTIKFMIESKNMPPFGFSISQEEKNQINNFLDGF